MPERSLIVVTKLGEVGVMLTELAVENGLGETMGHVLVPLEQVAKVVAQMQVHAPEAHP